MDDAYGYPPDMGTHLDIDDGALDRLLSAPGAESPAAESPAAGHPAAGHPAAENPAAAALAALLAAAAAPGEPGPLPGERAAIAAFQEAMRDAASGGRASRKRVNARITAVRLAAAGLAAGAVLAGGAAAATTGSLPSAAQQAAKDLLAHVGVTVPGPADAAAENPAERGHNGGAAGGEARDRESGERSEVATTVRTTTATVVDKGKAISEKASDGRGRAGGHAGEHGAPARPSAPAARVPVPNHGVGNGNHTGRDAPGPPSNADDTRGVGAGASSGSADGHR